ncbi:MAG TPA: transglutaminase-like domain-containing protein [Candidatus Baltobacteraceae bacterium]|nr:transglutaminase-like domain-containing protein [Candidatus Baltobacteraceae bacterium]
MGSHHVFRAFWWATNALLAVALLATLFTGIWEHSVREYLRGFSDAIIPEASSPEQKAQAILTWMSYGPPRREAPDPSLLSPHDPTDTLNYRQLLEVCGSATNAFLNLSRSSGLEARRLLLLSQDRTAKHVVAEVQIGGRWVIVDATYRAFMKDSQGRLLTRADLQDPRVFQEATAQIPGYITAYSYERVAHVRVGALPILGPFLRRALDTTLSGWDESLDWSLLLERRSFAFFFLSLWALIFFLLLRIVLAWIADHRLRIPRLRLRASLSRATATFFSTPEMK